MQLGGPITVDSNRPGLQAQALAHMVALPRNLIGVWRAQGIMRWADGRLNWAQVN